VQLSFCEARSQFPFIDENTISEIIGDPLELNVLTMSEDNFIEFSTISPNIVAPGMPQVFIDDCPNLQITNFNPNTMICP